MKFKPVDEFRLEFDLEYRVRFLREFMGLTDADVAVIQGSAAALEPHLPQLVEVVYEQMFAFDATRRHFLERHSDDPAPMAERLERLTLQDSVTRFRQQHFTEYFLRLMHDPFDGILMAYLDLVGKLHTSQAGSPQIVIPLVQMNAMLGFLSDQLIRLIGELGLAPDQERKTVRAFTKLLWLQNDLINRHYVQNAPSHATVEQASTMV
jgi:hypothetical protein